MGDTIVWINDAIPDGPLTIISKDNLWENRSAYLRWNYQKFSYIFNESGIYDMYIREYPRLHQTVVVKDTQTIEVASMPTATLTNILVINKTEEYTSNIPNGNISINNDGPTNNVPTNNGNAKTNLTDLIPIETMVAVVGIIILAVYIFRKK